MRRAAFLTYIHLSSAFVYNCITARYCTTCKSKLGAAAFETTLVEFAAYSEGKDAAALGAAIGKVISDLDAEHLRCVL